MMTSKAAKAKDCRFDHIKAAALVFAAFHLIMQSANPGIAAFYSTHACRTQPR
jgi:hypothetical protein